MQGAQTDSDYDIVSLSGSDGESNHSGGDDDLLMDGIRNDMDVPDDDPDEPEDPRYFESQLVALDDSLDTIDDLELDRLASSSSVSIESHAELPSAPSPSLESSAFIIADSDGQREAAAEAERKDDRSSGATLPVDTEKFRVPHHDKHGRQRPRHAPHSAAASGMPPTAKASSTAGNYAIASGSGKAKKSRSRRSRSEKSRTVGDTIGDNAMEARMSSSNPDLFFKLPQMLPLDSSFTSSCGSVTQSTASSSTSSVPTIPRATHEDVPYLDARGYAHDVDQNLLTEVEAAMLTPGQPHWRVVPPWDPQRYRYPLRMIVVQGRLSLIEAAVVLRQFAKSVAEADIARVYVDESGQAWRFAPDFTRVQRHDDSVQVGTNDSGDYRSCKQLINDVIIVDVCRTDSDFAAAAIQERTKALDAAQIIEWTDELARFPVTVPYARVAFPDIVRANANAPFLISSDTRGRPIAAPLTVGHIAQLTSADLACLKGTSAFVRPEATPFKLYDKYPHEYNYEALYTLDGSFPEMRDNRAVGRRPSRPVLAMAVASRLGNAAAESGVQILRKLLSFLLLAGICWSAGYLSTWAIISLFEWSQWLVYEASFLLGGAVELVVPSDPPVPTLEPGLTDLVIFHAIEDGPSWFVLPRADGLLEYVRRIEIEVLAHLRVIVAAVTTLTRSTAATAGRVALDLNEKFSEAVGLAFEHLGRD